MEASVQTVRLRSLPDGPYEVNGPLEISDRDGAPIDTSGELVHLCRCGRSANKPLRDGSHARTGWKEDA